nr:unnamed protein product [Callosobruchus analis]
MFNEYELLGLSVTARVQEEPRLTGQHHHYQNYRHA